MNHRVQVFKKALANIFRIWADNDYDTALEEVDALLTTWPGNPQLQILRASLIQLHDHPTSTLDDAKQALQEAVDLDPSSPAAAIELGHFLDAVEDNPKAASKQYTNAIIQARRLLIEGLIGQAKVLLQLDKKDEVLKCLVDLFHLTEGDSSAKRSKSASGPDMIVRSPTGRISLLEVKGPYAAQIEQLVNEVRTTE